MGSNKLETSTLNRREVLGLGLGASGLAAAGGVLTLKDARAATARRYGPAFDRLDRYVERFMREMNAPGLTLALADADGVQRIVDYGFEDLERRVALKSDRLFHIGSISKSFLGLCLVQLHEEGKLDFHRPVREYLPWLRFDDASAPITAHHLLTHGAALPDGALFPADPAFRHRATAPPGTLFHYCNMGYEALGLLLAGIDGGSVAESFRRRILQPLGMNASEPVISLDVADRIATSYTPRYNDRPFPRMGDLARSVPLDMQRASGCVAATARDMGAYLTMLIRRGATPSGRLISPEGFELFSARHLAAEHFGPGAAYGYGIAVDRIDDHTRLRHTGGMVSFASALEVDMDAGCGAFASINAMQGYRPRPITEYALRLMRAAREGASLPAPPQMAPSWQVANARDYAGRYNGTGDRALEITADGDRLYLLHQGKRVPLERSADQPDQFIVLHSDYAHFPLCFTRANSDGRSAVLEAGWGEQWYVATGYTGRRSFDVHESWAQHTGEYRSEDPWIGSARVVLRKGRLWLNGAVPLESATDGRFFLRDEPDSPEWVSFREPVNGKSCGMYLSGQYLQRV